MCLTANLKRIPVLSCKVLTEQQWLMVHRYLVFSVHLHDLHGSLPVVFNRYIVKCRGSERHALFQSCE